VKAVVVGGGSWGTAFAQLLRDRDHEVVLACREAGQARAIGETHRNPKYLPNADLRGIAGATIEEAPIATADLVVAAVPSAVFGDVVGALPGTAPVLILTKGLHPATGERLSTTVHGRPVAVLSGPNIADEISDGLPAATVVASDEHGLALELQREINSTRFRVYVNDDMLGVELCAAAKNVIALAAGAVDGLGLGDNAKAGMITRGLAEMRRLADACGANPDTFAGLAGMGDLIVTCFSPRGRNRRAGELIARGATAEEARQQIGHVVEGLTTAPVLHALSLRLGLELPITAGVCSVLSGTTLTDLLAELMRREPTAE
jgi:glycerol-3-phosphate dehydrogenase (NAD(P)+)